MVFAARIPAAVLVISLAGCTPDKATPVVTNGSAPAVRAEAPRPPVVTPAEPAGSARARPDSHDPFAVRAAGHVKAITGVVEAFNAHDAKALAGFYDPTCVVLSPRVGGFPADVGRESVAVGHDGLFASQPDVKDATARLLVAGDYAIHEWATTGTTTAGKAIGFRAATVYRFGGDGKIMRDATYFDLFTTAVQKGKKAGEVRPIPALPATMTVVVAGDGSDAASVVALKKLYAALAVGHGAEVAELFTADVVETSSMAAKDAVGRDAVVKELTDLAAQLPRAEVTGAWGDRKLGAAEVVLRGPARDGGGEAQLHVLHVVEMSDGHIQRSAVYANRLEVDEE